MALPEEESERNKRLESFKDDINKLATWIQGSHPEEVKVGGSAVEIAIRIMKRKK